jgi:tetratricopeptide (TPR) repeat protein
MMIRGFVAAAATALCLVAGLAHADPKSDIAAKSKQAMESYDLMDYEAAKKLLNQALATAKKAKLDKDPVTAHVYLDLGIAAFANSDPDTAKVAFQSAVQIDPKIKIDAAYKSPELDKLLEEARSETGGGGEKAPKGGGDSGVDCTTVKGFQHDIIDSGKRGAPQEISALVGSDLKASKVSMFYRAEGATEFTEVKLTAQGACKYVGNIPAGAM